MSSTTKLPRYIYQESLFTHRGVWAQLRFGTGVANEEQVNHNASYTGYYREGARNLGRRRENNDLARNVHIGLSEIGEDDAGDDKKAHGDCKHDGRLGCSHVSYMLMKI